MKRYLNQVAKRLPVFLFFLIGFYSLQGQDVIFDSEKSVLQACEGGKAKIILSPKDGFDFEYSLYREVDIKLEKPVAISNGTEPRIDYDVSGVYQLAYYSTKDKANIVIQNIVIQIANPPVFENTDNGPAYCVGETVTVSVPNPIPGASYSWSLDPQVSAQGGKFPNGDVGVSVDFYPNSSYYSLLVETILPKSLGSCELKEPVSTGYTYGEIPEQPYFSSISPYEVCEGTVHQYGIDNYWYFNSLDWQVIGGVIEKYPAIPDEPVTIRWDEGVTNGQVIVTGFSGGQNCSATEYFPVIINPKPEPVQLNDLMPMCEGETFTFSIKTPNSGSSFYWDSFSDEGYFIATSGPTATAEFYMPGMFSFQVTETVEVTQCSNTSNFSINLGAKPVLDKRDIYTDVCVGGVAEVTVSSKDFPNLDYQWIKLNSDANEVYNSPKYDTVRFQMNEKNAQYAVKGITLEGCESDETTVNITPHGLPEKAIITRADGQNLSDVCFGDFIKYEYTLPEDGYTEIYDVKVYGGQDNQGEINWNIPGAGKIVVYTKAIESPIQCLDSSEYFVEVHDNPILDFPGLIDLCQFEQKIIEGTVSNSTKGDVKWTTSGGITFDDPTLLNPTISSNTSSPMGYLGLVYTDLGPASCKASTSIDLSIHELPSAMIYPEKETLCQGETIILSSELDTESDFKWTGEGIADPASISPKVTPVNDGHYELEVISMYGCFNSDFIELNILEAPVFIADFSSQEVCEGEEILLEVTPNETTNTLTVSSQLGEIYVLDADNELKFTPLKNDVLTISADNGGVCSYSKNFTVDVFTAPDLNSTYAYPTDICKGDTIEIHTNYYQGYTYEWQGADLVSTDSSIVKAVADLGGAYSVKVITPGGCSSVSNTETVNVYDNPSFTMGVTSTEICNGESSELTIITDPSFNVSVHEIVNGNDTFFTPVNGKLTLIPSDTAQYYVTVNDYNSTAYCSAKDSLTVNVNTLPSVYIGSPLSEGTNVTMCIGEQFLLNARETSGLSNVELLWYKDDTFIQTGNNIPTTIDGDVTYKVIAKTEKGCKDTSGNATVIATPLPIVDVNLSYIICEGDSANIVTEVSNNNITSLSIDLNGFKEQLNVMGKDSISVKPLQTTRYPIDITDDLGCFNTINVDVLVNPSPNTLQIDGVPEVGKNKATNYKLTNGLQGSTYQWFISPEDGSVNLPTSSTQLSNSLTFTKLGVYTLQVVETSEFGCEAQNPKLLTVAVKEKALSDPNLSVSGMYKEFGTLPFDLPQSFSYSKGEITYSLTEPSECIFLDGKKVTVECADTVIYKAIQKQTDLYLKDSAFAYIVIGKTNVKRSIRAKKSLAIGKTPYLIPLSTATVINGDTAYFEGEVTYTIISDTSLASITNEGIITPKIEGTVVVLVEGTSSNRFNDWNEFVTFNIVPELIKPVAAPDSATVVAGQTYSFNILKNDTAYTGDIVVPKVDLDTLIEGIQYYRVIENYGEFLVQDSILSFTPRDGFYGEVELYYTITDADDLKSSPARIAFYVEKPSDDLQLVANQVLTPNGDSKNDILFIKNTDVTSTSNLLRVYDEAGNLVYEENDYQNDWNGVDSDGENLPVGVYYFSFEETGGSTYQDFFHIIR